MPAVQLSFASRLRPAAAQFACSEPLHKVGVGILQFRLPAEVAVITRDGLSGGTAGSMATETGLRPAVETVDQPPAPTSCATTMGIPCLVGTIGWSTVEGQDGRWMPTREGIVKSHTL